MAEKYVRLVQDMLEDSETVVEEGRSDRWVEGEGGIRSGIGSEPLLVWSDGNCWTLGSLLTLHPTLDR